MPKLSFLTLFQHLYFRSISTHRNNAGNTPLKRNIPSLFKVTSPHRRKNDKESRAPSSIFTNTVTFANYNYYFPYFACICLTGTIQTVLSGIHEDTVLFFLRYDAFLPIIILCYKYFSTLFCLLKRPVHANITSNR